MTAPPDDTTTDLHAVIAALRAERDAALSEKAALANELAAQAAEMDTRTAELADRKTEFDERIEHQAATADVLRVMSASPGDTQPVFDLIVRRAVELCNAQSGGLFLYDGERVHIGTIHGLYEHEGKLLHVQSLHGTEPDIAPASLAAYLRQFPMPPKRGSISMRAILDCQIMHVRDMREEVDLLQDVQRLGHRSQVSLPLVRDAKAIGVITMAAHEPGGFSESQIALLQTFAEQAVIAITSAETFRALQTRTSDLQETLEYQTATSDVLKVIGRSTFDLQPVLDTVVETAARLCDAERAAVFRREGDLWRMAANFGFPPAWEDYMRTQGAFSLNRFSEHAAVRAVVERRPVQIDDMAAVPGYENRLGDQRTTLGVPLLRDGETIGTIVLARLRVEPFTDRQIELVSTFADQAVIAIENARLLTEQREALEQQTATAEVLQVINTSPGDLAPVFDAVLERALRLCAASFGLLYTYDGENFHTAAHRGVPRAFAEFRAKNPPAELAGGRSPIARLINQRRSVHILDILDDEVFITNAGVEGRSIVDLGGARTILNVPLVKDDTLQGYISIYRQEVRAFSDKQIALLESFAAQAVIAMDNARLITEQREALEQQTATAEVLQVINSSPGNLAPVFDAMLDKAMHLCDAAFGYFATYDGERFHHVVGRGLPPAFADFLRTPSAEEPGSAALRVVGGEAFVHITDLLEDEGTRQPAPVRRASIEMGGARTQIIVPLRKDSVLLGILILHRQQVRPFTDRQIALLQNFAAQAVIAMENARLITEQREALEQQTATAEVLQVINSSPGDLAPVFEAMVERAATLCEADEAAVRTFDGSILNLVATHGPADLFEELKRLGPSHPDGLYEAIAQGASVSHFVDVRETEAFQTNPRARERLELRGIRSWLAVALRKEGALLGVINVHRREVRPFTEKQIALLQNFAAQAVIAMENARLLTEQREALEQQTATAEVLQVINASPGNLAPVFDAILNKAHTLCDATLGSLASYDGKLFHRLAMHGFPPEYEALVRPPNKPLPHLQRLLDGARIVHDADIVSARSYQDDPFVQAAAKIVGIRTALFVPLRKDSRLLGYISAQRREVRPFSEKEITLLENFATQAVIAMENARLITETREALEQQTATAEVLQVINSSPGNLAPVFDAMLQRATQLCGTAIGTFWSFNGEAVQVLASTLGDAGETMWPGPGTALWRIAHGERVVQIADVAAEPAYRADTVGQMRTRLAGTRTALAVALRKDETLVGAITTGRPEVRPFSDKEIALLENFAAQAVIAMENARLLTEQREALEQQTATAEVLEVINASPGDLTPVFDAMLEKALHLCEAAFGNLRTYDGEVGRLAAICGASPEYRAELMRAGPQKPEPGASLIRLVEGEPLVHIADIRAEGAHRSGPAVRRMLADRAGARTVLWVPMRKDGALLGFFTIYRTEVRPFTDKQIALLQNFAAQAVIAMENARLLTEQREALEQQTATAEVLQVINASPGNLVPVFDAILDKALRLCEAAFGSLVTYDGEYFQVVATRGMSAGLAKALRERGPLLPSKSIAYDQIVRGADIVHIPDIIALGAPFPSSPNIDQDGARTTLFVALRGDDALFGAFIIFRKEVRLFSDKQIALLKNFAAQAVIAMENARLLVEIRQRQEELRVTFENMGDGVALFDETQHLVAWNRKFQNILDVPDDVIARRQTFSEYVRYLAERGEYGADADVEEQVHRLLETAGQMRVFERVRPNGRVIEVRSNPVAGGGFVLIYADITERKRSEAEIRAARDAAEEASRTIEAAYRDLKAAQANLIQAEKMASLGQLTAGIAHEIKNPLNFVNNFADLSTELLDELHSAVAGNRQAEIDELTATLKGNLVKITEHGKRADGIVKAMLEHSRGSSGERRTVDLNALIDEALNLAYHGARAQDQSFNITLERDFGEGIAPIEVNPQDITRVFLNIFSNGFYAATRRAREDADAGFVPTLKVTTRDAGDAVEIRVRDNGTGIPADIRDKLFQPFFTTKPTGEGTGLGLSITYDIVTQQHSGSIAVDSKVGEYSEFTIRLPRNPG